MEPVYAQPQKDSVARNHADRIHQVMSRLVLDQRPGSVLEVGCGAGVVGSIIAGRGIRYVGLDPDDESLSKARANFPDLKIFKGSSYDDPNLLQLGTFDLVCSNDVIEHVYEPRKFMAFVHSHLNEGGIFVCGTPNYGSYTRNLLLSIFNKWDHHHNPLWDGGHIKFFSKRTLSQLFAECGFRVERWQSVSSSRLPLISSALFCIAVRK